MTDMIITKSIFIKAPAHHVWTFLTDGEKLATWFHRGTGSFTETGQDWTLVTNSYGKDGEPILTGRVLEADAPHRFVHTFTHQWIDGVETRCEWTLSEVEGGTIVHLVHTGWEAVGDAAFAKAADHDRGWDEHLTRLRMVAG